MKGQCPVAVANRLRDIDETLEGFLGHGTTRNTTAFPVVGTGVDPVTSRVSGRIGRLGRCASNLEKSENSLLNQVERAAVRGPLMRAVSHSLGHVWGTKLHHTQ
jgi:hypothetical protein